MPYISSWTVNSLIGYSIAVIVGGNRNIPSHSPLEYLVSVARAQNMPFTISEDSRVDTMVAIVIGRDRSVSGQSKSEGPETIRASQNVPDATAIDGKICLSVTI